LSYQAKTFTERAPSIIVDLASKIAEWLLPMTSLETISSSVYSRTFFIGPLAAALNAAFTDSLVASLLSSQTRSTIEPSGTGTRSDVPSSLPFRSGRTLPTARAAPVEVGMMFTAAARARRRSLWIRSETRWSLV
jgi:hypothetical protein